MIYLVSFLTKLHVVTLSNYLAVGNRTNYLFVNCSHTIRVFYKKNYLSSSFPQFIQCIVLMKSFTFSAITWSNCSCSFMRFKTSLCYFNVPSEVFYTFPRHNCIFLNWDLLSSWFQQLQKTCLKLHNSKTYKLTNQRIKCFSSNCHSKRVTRACVSTYWHCAYLNPRTASNCWKYTKYLRKMFSVGINIAGSSRGDDANINKVHGAGNPWLPNNLLFVKMRLHVIRLLFSLFLPYYSGLSPLWLTALQQHL